VKVKKMEIQNLQKQ
jgi:COP9 signalosome complex subunit 1